jgi:hypothetical protein
MCGMQQGVPSYGAVPVPIGVPAVGAPNSLAATDSARVAAGGGDNSGKMPDSRTLMQATGFYSSLLMDQFRVSCFLCFCFQQFVGGSVCLGSLVFFVSVFSRLLVDHFVSNILFSLFPFPAVCCWWITVFGVSCFLCFHFQQFVGGSLCLGSLVFFVSIFSSLLVDHFVSGLFVFFVSIFSSLLLVDHFVLGILFSLFPFSAVSWWITSFQVSCFLCFHFQQFVGGSLRFRSLVFLQFSTSVWYLYCNGLFLFTFEFVFFLVSCQQSLFLIC